MGLLFQPQTVMFQPFKAPEKNTLGESSSICKTKRKRCKVVNRDDLVPRLSVKSVSLGWLSMVVSKVPLKGGIGGI